MAAGVSAETALLDRVMKPVRIFEAIGGLLAVRDDGFDNERVFQFGFELSTGCAMILRDESCPISNRASGITALSFLGITEHWSCVARLS